MSDDVGSSRARHVLIEQTRAETGIDEAMIERLVRAFYERVKADAGPGPGFRRSDRRLGTSHSENVPILVLGGFDERPLSRSADGETPAAAG
jgi:hypothetical protein